MGSLPTETSTLPRSPREETDQEVDRVKRSFLASLNHELRTPLTGILGMLDLLSETELSEEQTEYVKSSRACAETLLESITNAIEFSSLAAGSMTYVNSEFRPAETLQAAVSARESKAVAKGLHLSLLLDSQLPEVAVSDAHRIRQIVDILLSNAVKYTQYGDIEVLASAAPDEEGRNRLSVSVRDTGPGIPAEYLSRVFLGSTDRDRTSLADANTGMKVGLPLAKQLVEAMGGQITAESYPGQGSLFTFTLPLGAPMPVDLGRVVDAVGTSDAPPPPVGRNILVVEDNSVAQRFLKTLLERRGFRVVVAPSGFDAIEIVGRERFDLILMDLQMPGIDGMDTTRRVRELPNAEQVPIIACTANPTSDVRSDCIAAGMNDFLSKPVNTAELMALLEYYLPGSAVARPAGGATAPR